MQVKKSLPTNEHFFNAYAASVSTFQRNSYFAQIVSAGTEIGVIYLFFYRKFSEVFSPERATIAAGAVALFGTFFLESSLRSSLQSLIRQILNKRFAGLHLWITSGDCLTTVFYVFISAALSFSGSKEVIAPRVVGEVSEINFDAISQNRSSREAAINDTYRGDRAGIENRFNNQIEAIKESYTAKIEAKFQERKKYERKQRKTGTSYASRIARINGQIAAYKSDRAAEVAKLQGRKSSALANVEGIKNKKLETNQSEYSREKNRIENRHERNLRKNADQVQTWGLGFGWFSITALCYLIYALMRIEIILHGSGVKETPRPTQYDFKQGILSEALEAIKERWQRFTYGLISAFASKTRPPLAPTEKDEPVLYDTDGIGQTRVKVEMDELEAPVIIVPALSEKFLQQLAKGEAYLQPHQKQSIGFKSPSQLADDATNISARFKTVGNTYSPTKSKKRRRGTGGSGDNQNPTKSADNDFIIYAGRNTELAPRKYSYSRVTSRISRHKERIRELEKREQTKRTKNAIQNNKGWLEYWQNRIQEFN